MHQERNRHPVLIVSIPLAYALILVMAALYSLGMIELGGEEMPTGKGPSLVRVSYDGVVKIAGVTFRVSRINTSKRTVTLAPMDPKVTLEISELPSVMHWIEGDGK